MSNLDAMLKELLLKNPSLMKTVQKELGVKDKAEAQTQPKEKRKYSRPEPDYRLIVFSGCETCHTISEVSYEMTWDEEKRFFKPRLLCGLASKKAFITVKKQAITTLTCSHCTSTLSGKSAAELANLIILMQDPIETEARLQVFKRSLRKNLDLQAPADKE